MPSKSRFLFSNLRAYLITTLIGPILIGCNSIDSDERQQRPIEHKSSQKVETSDRDVRVENSQKVEIKGRDARISSRSSVTTTTDGTETRSESIEKDTQISQQDRSSNKIVDGRYWVGATDQGLEVQGDRYRYDTEAGEQPWQNISSLKYVKDGVVFDGKTYWCLSKLAPAPPTGCSADGWSN